MTNCVRLILAFFLVLVTAVPGAVAADDDMPRLMKIDRKFNTGDFVIVLDEGTKYVEDYPRSYQGWTMLGWAYLKTDQLEKAKECFDRAISIDSTWDNSHVGKGALYRKLNDHENARKSYLEAIRLRPQNAEAYASLMVIEILEGKDEKAVEYGEKAWALRKDLSSIPANLAVAYHYLGDMKNRNKYTKYAELLGYYRMDTLQEIFDGTIKLR